MIKDTVRLGTSNTDALDLMNRLNLDAAVLVDEHGAFRGVVERDQIMGRLLVALARATEDAGARSAGNATTAAVRRRRSA
jgi:CBS domain-containing protein